MKPIRTKPSTVASLPRYWKTVMAVLALLAMVGQEVVQALAETGADGTLDSDDTTKIVIAAIGALLVYWKKNTPPAGQPSDPNVSEVDAPGYPDEV